MLRRLRSHLHCLKNEQKLESLNCAQVVCSLEKVKGLPAVRYNRRSTAQLAKAEKEWECKTGVSLFVLIWDAAL